MKFRFAFIFLTAFACVFSESVNNQELRVFTKDQLNEFNGKEVAYFLVIFNSNVYKLITRNIK